MKKFTVKRTWSTRKFYEDFMWACKTYGINPKKAIKILENDSGCPMINLHCQANRNISAPFQVGLIIMK